MDKIWLFPLPFTGYVPEGLDPVAVRLVIEGMVERRSYNHLYMRTKENKINQKLDRIEALLKKMGK